MKIQTKATLIAAFACALFASGADASVIPVASDWSAQVTTLVARNNGTSNTSISDVTGGVTFHYDEGTGGFGIGTDTRQYDFTTTAALTGALDFNVNLDLSTFLGFYDDTFGLSIIRNGSVVQTLYATGSAPSNITQLYLNNAISLSSGDTWGVRVIAGNFDESNGVTGNVTLTQAVPEPAPLVLLALGLPLILVFRRFVPASGAKARS